MSDLAIRLHASLNVSDDVEALATEIEEQGFRLLALARRIHRVTAYGNKPGKGTLARIDAVTRRLGQAGAAYRAGRA